MKKRKLISIFVVTLMILNCFAMTAYAREDSWSSTIDITNYITTSVSFSPSSDNKIAVSVDADLYSTSTSTTKLTNVTSTLTVKLYDVNTGSYVGSKSYGPQYTWDTYKVFSNLNSSHRYKVRFETSNSSYHLRGHVYVDNVYA